MSFLDWIFGRKKEDEDDLREELKRSFSHVKRDFSRLSTWIEHFNKKHSQHDTNFNVLVKRLEKIEIDLEEIKEISQILGSEASPFKRPQTVVQTAKKQTPVQTVVQTVVQTAKFTSKLKSYTTNERVILWTLLNSDLKLSYDDIATILGKDPNTIKGQLNNIRQKSEGLVEESVDKNNKKRFFIKRELKENMLDQMMPETRRESSERPRHVG